MLDIFFMDFFFIFLKTGEIYHCSSLYFATNLTSIIACFENMIDQIDVICDSRSFTLEIHKIIC